jgi:sec-independent protein translocase protein TatC
VEEQRFTLTQHLLELRRRLVRAVIGLIVAIGAAFFFAPQIFQILKGLAPEGFTPVFIDPTEMLGTYFRVAFLGGMVLAMPLLIYELVMFISPGLTGREKRYLFWLLPGATLLFVLGIAFSYFVLLPPALKFLFTFGSEIATPQIRIGKYVSLLTRLLFWVGVSFETPLVMFFLAKIGLITPHFLARKWRLAVVIAFVLGALITPTFDPINQTLVALPIIALYWLGILLAFLARPRKRGSPETEPEGK